MLDVPLEKEHAWVISSTTQVPAAVNLALTTNNIPQATASLDHHWTWEITVWKFDLG